VSYARGPGREAVSHVGSFRKWMHELSGCADYASEQTLCLQAKLGYGEARTYSCVDDRCNVSVGGA
jgi:hypothetical protein